MPECDSLGSGCMYILRIHTHTHTEVRFATYIITIFEREISEGRDGMRGGRISHSGDLGIRERVGERESGLFHSGSNRFVSL